MFHVCEKFMGLISQLSILVKMADLIQSQLTVFSGKFAMGIVEGLQRVPADAIFPTRWSSWVLSV